LLHGYEIKAEADTLSRLATQVPAFNACFDRMTLVVDAQHFGKAAELVPEWWGLLVIEREHNALRFSERRICAANPDLDARSFLFSLWRPELQRILDDESVGYGATDNKRNLRERVLRHVPFEKVHARALDLLRSRTRWRGSVI
ncbi:MAG: sce7726 family protein, partial [Candidatus Eremiobacteraeota bacterium]|nr:sce7726 family protein [Candidatus Eremiobacteraeota bacterium]